MSDQEKEDSPIVVDDTEDDVKNIKLKAEDTDPAVPRKRVGRVHRLV
jgi:hypothetical protein